MKVFGLLLVLCVFTLSTSSKDVESPLKLGSILDPDPPGMPAFSAPEFRGRPPA